MPKTSNQIRTMTLGTLKKQYEILSDGYRDIVNDKYVFCPKCRQWHEKGEFLRDPKSESKDIVRYACLKCMVIECCDYNKDTEIYYENSKKVAELYQKLDWKFDEYEFIKYTSSLTNSGRIKENIAIKKMLTDYSKRDKNRNAHFIESIYDKMKPAIQEKDEMPSDVEKTIEEARKRFGYGYTPEDYIFLENKYQDWISRCGCETKPQEVIYERIAFKELEIHKATKAGLPTKDLDATLQSYLTTANITPKQVNIEADTDGDAVLGTLLKKWEETKPLPEVDEDLKDVDKIGLLIDVFFRGHTCKALGIKNKLSDMYEKYIQKYTVNKPEYTEENSDEDLFKKIFGSLDDEV